MDWQFILNQADNLDSQALWDLLINSLAQAELGIFGLSNWEELLSDHLRAEAAHWAELAKPLRAYGQLEDLHAQVLALAKLRSELMLTPPIEENLLMKTAVVLFAADNQVVYEGVSQSGFELTAQVFKNIAAGEASIAILAEAQGLDLLAFNLGIMQRRTGEQQPVLAELDRLLEQANLAGRQVFDLVIRPDGAGNIRREAALSWPDLIEAMAVGFRTAEKLILSGTDCIIGAELGSGNTTSSACVAAKLLGLKAEEVAGRGAGLSDQALLKKQAVIKDALARTTASQALDILRELGGLDLAALLGLYLGAHVHACPIVLDGLISLAAASLLQSLIPAAANNFLASHLAKERGAHRLAERFSFQAPLRLDLAMGEGAGASFILPLLEQCHLLYRRLPKFEEVDLEPFRDYSQARSQLELIAFPEEFYKSGEVSLVIGGEKSGKSDFTEAEAFALANSIQKPLLYVATLYIGDDEENLTRARRHQSRRAGYGFKNLEIYFDFNSEQLKLPKNHIVLLDSLGNLLANRLYRPVDGDFLISEDPDDLIVAELFEAVMSLARRSAHLFIVADDLARSMPPAAVESKRFIRLHGKLLQAIGREGRANLFELVAGIPTLLKRSEQIN
ncbi:MAG: bifunctional adenosylcobinamide kinase/adenosylcobinamide-phosphate guanylyltransferase [Eubacteriales bacterium]|nr:bifunctional adenosylcobinamide kinase/adenosylcobinamide-phosphate guanylyltransferase [Eubacteriales bacterium]